MHITSTKAYRSWFSWERHDFPRGTFWDGFYESLDGYTVRIYGEPPNGSHNGYFVMRSRVKGRDYRARIDFMPTEHSAKLQCAKFVKQVASLANLTIS